MIKIKHRPNCIGVALHIAGLLPEANYQDATVQSLTEEYGLRLIGDPRQADLAILALNDEEGGVVHCAAHVEGNFFKHLSWDFGNDVRTEHIATIMEQRQDDGCRWKFLVKK